MVPRELLIDAEVLARRAADRTGTARQLTLDEALREDEHHDHPHEHLHDGYTAVDVSTGRLDARATADLLCDPPPGVFRVKGFVTVADGTRMEVHAVGRHVRTAPERGRRGGAESVLVFLGVGLDGDDVRRRVEACSVRPDAAPDPRATLSLLRFSAAAQSDSAILED